MGWTYLSMLGLKLNHTGTNMHRRSSGHNVDNLTVTSYDHRGVSNHRQLEFSLKIYNNENVKAPHQWPPLVDSPNKTAVMRKAFPYRDAAICICFKQHRESRINSMCMFLKFELHVANVWDTKSPTLTQRVGNLAPTSGHQSEEITFPWVVGPVGWFIPWTYPWAKNYSKTDIYALGPRQPGRQFADDIFESIFWTKMLV